MEDNQTLPSSSTDQLCTSSPNAVSVFTDFHSNGGIEKNSTGLSTCRHTLLHTRMRSGRLFVDISKVTNLEHLKIKTRLIDEKFTSVMGECVI